MRWNAVLLTCCVPVLASSAPSVSVADIEYALANAPFDMDIEELLAEWDRMDRACGVSPRCERQVEPETGQWVASILALEQAGKVSVTNKPQRDQMATNGGNTDKKRIPDTVVFAVPKTPKDFAKHWPEQKCLFESLERPLSHDQVRVLRDTYYRFTVAGRLLEELGEEAFLQQYGGGSIEEMQKAATAEIQQRKAAERASKMAGGIIGANIDAIVRPTSPEDFVERWPEQKRLFEGLPRPLTPEHARALWSAYYPFTAAGQLLEELGEKAFLERFGKNTAKSMEKATKAVMMQRRAAAKDQERANDADDAKEKETPNVVAFGRAKTPKNFVELWPIQTRLFESLPRPFSPEQRLEVKSHYYHFAAAGRLLAELGEEVFLQRFGKSTVNQMQQDTRAAARQKKVGENDQEAGIVDVDNAEDAGSTRVDIDTSIEAFTKPKSPKNFVEIWPEQKRLFEGLPRPLTPEQRRVLGKTYYRFSAAGQLLDEFGKEAFLQKYGRSSVEKMRGRTVAEIQKRRAAEEDRKIAEKAKAAGEGKGSGIVIFARPKSPKDFVKCWSEQKRLFKSLPRFRTPEQQREINCAYHQFTAAGQLLEELGEEVFLQKYGKGSVTWMRQATAEEVKQRKAAEGEKPVAETVIFRKPSSPKKFVKHWPEQKRLFEGLQRPFSPEQAYELKNTYYAFTAAGQLLEELGKKAFLKKYGMGSVGRMQSATAAEMRQRKEAERGGTRQNSKPAKAKDESMDRNTDKPTRTSKTDRGLGKNQKKPARNNTHEKAESDESYGSSPQLENCTPCDSQSKDEVAIPKKQISPMSTTKGNLVRLPEDKITIAVQRLEGRTIIRISAPKDAGKS